METFFIDYIMTEVKDLNEWELATVNSNIT